MFETFVDLHDDLASMGCAGYWEADYTMGRVRTAGPITQIYGLTPEQGTNGASWAEVDRAWHPGDRDMIQALRRFPSELKSGSSIVRFRVIDPGGQVRVYEGHRNVLVDRDGLLLRTRGLLFQIHEAGPVRELAAQEAPLAGLDLLSANLLQAFRQARHLGLSEVEADLKPTLTKVVHLLGRKFRRASLH